MSADRREVPPSPTPSLEGRVDEVCDRYEAAWKASGEPQIETYLDAEFEAERPALFRHLLALELARIIHPG